MPDCYMIINGRNGHASHIHNDSKAWSALNEFNQKKYKISVVALGAGPRYVVICDNGVWKSNAPDSFNDKMHSITVSNVKQVKI